MIIGRERELKRLRKAYSSKEAEFIVVYGRRRVGKTFLVREFFEKQKCLFMHVTGVHKAKYQKQIEKFTESMSKTFFDNAPLETPKSWEEAFKLLNQQVIKNSKQKLIIFLDELPWLATSRSGMLQTIDYYWNHNWSKLNHVVLVVCGSSASWLIKNIIYNKGGLHNRVTCEIRLLPFSLSETRDFLKHHNITLNNRHILSIYMALGGIPYYLRYIEPGITAEQNIQQIIFDQDAPLKDEFTKLFKSLFKKADVYIEIIKLLAHNKSGLTRAEIAVNAKLSTNGGRLSERLNDLLVAGFIAEHTPWKDNNGQYYKLIDEFCLFYIHWIGHHHKNFIQDHWVNQANSQSYKSWSGYSFESVCMKHIDQIVQAMKIKSSGVIDSWKYAPRKHIESGAQIDLLIDRSDDSITICEIKYTNKPFDIDKAYAANLEKKVTVYKKITKTTKQIFLSMISASGIKHSERSAKLISNVVTLDDLIR